MKSRLITSLTLVALATPFVARAEPQGGNVATPDERVDVTVEGEQTGPDAGYATVRGNAGAYHFDNTVEAGSSGFRVTNPPMWGAVGTNGEEFPELYGPPVARAALGVGGLTANFKHAGVLSGLNWPGPGFYDHVNYLHRTRGWENGGAAENAGSFAGLVLPDTFEQQVTWFTEVEGWVPVDQAYDGERSGVLRTELVNDEFDGTRVVIRDVVHPETDVLARDIEVENPPGGARLAYYANMNPTTGRAPRTPSVTDALLDDASDFATTYDADAGAMLHFRPYRLDPAAATAAATSRLDPEIAQAAIERTIGADGVHIAIAADRPAAEFQAGVDAAGLARDEFEGSPLLDPYYDAADGSLSGSTAAIGKTAGAQVWDATSATVYVSAAGTSDEALAAVSDAAAAGFDAIQDAADDDWDEWLGGVRLPDSDDPQVQAVSTRALMLIRTATDRQTGAIVANTTTQTPYRQDWLRDGAFFNYALLLAGTDAAVEMVEAHNDFYVRHQSETGHWDPILCTDGAHCDAAFPFEIDSQAFGVWSLWMEHEFTGDVERLEANYEAIRKGAEVLWACQDPTNGLQCYASEDDHPDPSQGPQGAATVYLGLRSAADAARVVEGEDSEDAARWDERADELKAAATEAFCDETCGTGRGYMIWPGRVLEPEDQHTQDTLDERADTLRARMTFEAPRADPENPGFFQYPMEPIFGLATAWQHADKDTLLPGSIEWLTHAVAEPGVLHYGERIFHVAPGEYVHGVGFPHIWSGTEVYIAAALVLGAGDCSAAEAASGDTCRVIGGGSAEGGGGGATAPGGGEQDNGEQPRGGGEPVPSEVGGALAATGGTLFGLSGLALGAVALELRRRRNLALRPS